MKIQKGGSFWSDKSFAFTTVVSFHKFFNYVQVGRLFFYVFFFQIKSQRYVEIKPLQLPMKEGPNKSTVCLFFIWQNDAYNTKKYKKQYN